jgi:two-component system chemotaxis sensor kinase CheA/chemotaxis protein CheC
MKVDVRSLGTFDQLAHEGAEQATASMTRMTGIEARVDVTRISLVDRADVGEELGDGTYVGMNFDFEDALGGETVLAFDDESAKTILEAMMPGSADDEAMARSGVEEIGTS